MTDSELSSLYGESDPSLRGGTGVGGRRWVGPGEATSDLATAAGRAALESLGADGAVDVVILATATPDHPAPATAPLVARRLGLREVPAFDLAAMGSGFVYGLAVADGMIAAGTARRILLIGADAFSTILNPNDRSTAAEFADGAGAVVLRAGERDEPGALHGIDLGSDGYLADLITLSAGGTRQPDRDAARPADRWLAVRGQALHRHTALRMTAAARTALARAGWRPGDVDRFVAQQTNASTLVAVAAELGIPEDRMYRDSGRTGDTVAACIPLALTAAAADGELRAGDRVLVAAFGGGATWGAAALTWPDL